MFIVFSHSVIASISQFMCYIYISIQPISLRSHKEQKIAKLYCGHEKQFKRQSSHLVKGRSGEHKSKVIVHFYESFRAGRVLQLSDQPKEYIQPLWTLSS